MSNSKGLSLGRLQELLREDADRQREKEVVRESHKQRYQHLASSIDDVWRHLGVLPPGGEGEHSNQKHWVRPLVQPNLYQCPLSAPQTTLVSWKSLPAHVQFKLKASGVICPVGDDDDDDIVEGKHDESPGIVEVPLEYLSPSGDDARPIKGNLSDKLTEYTRGMAGQRSRPFRPGGLGAEEVAVVSDKVDPYRTEEAIARSMRVLEQGSEASWKDGTLITAPPGVDFKVGLSFSDVRGKDDETTAAIDKGEEKADVSQPEIISSVFEITSQQQQTITAPTLASSTQQQGIFSRAYFDDDSLFGSSSSSESGSDDENIDDLEDDVEAKVVDKAPEGTTAVFVDGFDPSTLMIKGTTEDDADDENIDQLLMDLTVSDEKLFTKKSGTAANPLELAQRQSHNQNNTTRKSWASTKPLPISDFNALIPSPALTYPFTLDDFQQQAVARLERSESVFVAAHTSAGKTVVAEYAVALAKQRATRCIYTSPIKALSNQKFRDFSLKFGSENVGLVTGDLQVNMEDSTCLIMTTEILRSMLYRGADLIRDIEFVVFDEVHYVNDTERGVVWEEVIIMLPSYVNLIFLSATTPNTLEFSDWIGRTKRKVVHVIKTDYRPVPLSHFLWAGSKLHKIRQGDGSFIQKGFANATDALLPSSAKDPAKKGEQKGRPATGSKQLAWQAQGTKQNWMSLVRFLDRELLTPAVVFSFSKKKCEEIANMLRSLDLNTAKEKSAVQSFALQTVARLSQNDAKLPQVMIVVEMVQRGIGVHHGGLLPILKEMVEILFSRNLIKVLFATETFAMGVNMPAKAVVFNSIRKHDGNQFRVLEPGEYTQMAGRAGRRGLDKVGTVIICCFGETPPPQPILRQMLTGTSTRLSSQFRLTYNMILNLLKVEEMSVESMIKRSFSEFATQRALAANEYPQLLARGVRTLEKLESQSRRDTSSRVGAEDIEHYFQVCSELRRTSKDVLLYIKETDSASFEELFQPGRVVYVTAARQYGAVRAPAMILRTPVSSSDVIVSKRENTANQGAMVCLMLLPPSYVPTESASEAKPSGTIGFIGSSKQRHYAICEIEMGQVVLFDKKRRKIDTKAILKEDPGVRGQASFGRPQSSFPMSGRNAVDPFAGMKASGKKNDDGDLVKAGSDAAKEDTVINQAVAYLIEAENAEVRDAGASIVNLQNLVKRGNDVVHFRRLCDRIEELISQMRSLASHRHPNLEKYYMSIERTETLRTKVETLRHLLSNESLQLFPDFLQRKEVLKKLGYIDENETVCVKGRVACEVNTCDELIATEMVFEGLLNDLEPTEIVAVLSALVYQQKSSDEDFDSELPEKLVNCCQQMKTIATNLGRLQRDCGLKIDPGEYCDGSLKFGLVHVVYEWALGVPFANICDLTDAQEGSIVRCITRLDELCREIRNCARVVGNPTLYRKLEAASVAIKRDIVFASSLYVS